MLALLMTAVCTHIGFWCVQRKHLIRWRWATEHCETACWRSSHGICQRTMGLHRHWMWTALSDCLANITWQWRLQRCQYDYLFYV